MIEEVVLYCISFLIFVVSQSLAINGIYECFRGGCVNDIVKGKVCSGNIFYQLSPDFFEKHKNKIWAKPLFGCLRCMSSVYGALTFWPIVIMVFGFYPIEIIVFVFDVFILVYLNMFFYKRL